MCKHKIHRPSAPFVLNFLIVFLYLYLICFHFFCSVSFSAYYDGWSLVTYNYYIIIIDQFETMLYLPGCEHTHFRENGKYSQFQNKLWKRESRNVYLFTINRGNQTVTSMRSSSQCNIFCVWETWHINSAEHQRLKSVFHPCVWSASDRSHGVGDAVRTRRSLSSLCCVAGSRLTSSN